MTAAEFREALERLELTPERLAAETRFSARKLEAIHRGLRSVPERIARELEWRLAMQERESVLAAGGPPACPAADALRRRAAGAAGPAERLALLEEARRHAERCPVCAAREAYAAAHGAPPPERPGAGLPEAEGIAALPDRLADALGVPRGAAGAWRRDLLARAALLSALVLVLSPVYVWVESTRVGWGPRLLLVPLQVLLVVPGYFTGFLLAGWVMDATRPLAHRFRGYALRGSLGATAVYGAVGLVLPLLDRDVRLWPDVAATLPFIAAFGLLAGAGWWARDRLTGRLGPPPPRR